MKRLALLSVILPILIAGAAYAGSPRVRCKPTCPAANRHVNGHPKTNRQAVLPNTSNRTRSAQQKFQLFLNPAASALSESLVSNLDPTAKINWASNYHSGPSQFQLDSDRCRRFASAVSKRGRKSNNFGKHILPENMRRNVVMLCPGIKGQKPRLIGAVSNIIDRFLPLKSAFFVHRCLKLFQHANEIFQLVARV